LQTAFLSLDQVALLCRYFAFFSLRGIAEWAVHLANYLPRVYVLKRQQAAELEAPMVEQLGMLKGMERPKAWSSGLSRLRNRQSLL